ncbi:MAG: hypothetical protein GW893_09125 [Armatimonadetes bacterium]|nr:hypothetical protein [Armatimonadota bacterium]
MLTKEGCLRRQERLRNRLEESHVDATIICDPANVYYLTGWMAHPRLPVCAVLTNEGVCSLIAADQPEPSAAHKVYRYNGRLGGGSRRTSFRRSRRGFAKTLMSCGTHRGTSELRRPAYPSGSQRFSKRKNWSARTSCPICDNCVGARTRMSWPSYGDLSRLPKLLTPWAGRWLNPDAPSWRSTTPCTRQ